MVDASIFDVFDHQDGMSVSMHALITPSVNTHRFNCDHHARFKLPGRPQALETWALAALWIIRTIAAHIMGVDAQEVTQP